MGIGDWLVTKTMIKGLFYSSINSKFYVREGEDIKTYQIEGKEYIKNKWKSWIVDGGFTTDYKEADNICEELNDKFRPYFSYFVIKTNDKT